jgi:uncharacterized integral membrane protein (TIGR00697 family)
MNEVLFLIHILIVLVFGGIALRLGRASLTTWVSLQAVLANLFILKQIKFLGFEITCSDVYAIGSMLGLNLLREYFGKQPAQVALRTCFFAMIFFAAMAQFHLQYIPSSSDRTQSAYEILLSPSARLLIASFVVFFVVQRIDLYLYSFLKEKWPRLSLSLRNAVSLLTSQFLDTFLFSVLGLWGLVSSLSDIIAVSFLVKATIIGCITPLVRFSKRFVPREAEVK